MRVAVDGREALAVLASEEVDLILMDCWLPNMDGYEATRIIREGGAGIPDSDITVIALTAHQGGEERRQCFRSGMNDVMHKPIDLEELRSVLCTWLLPHLRPERHAA